MNHHIAIGFFNYPSGRSAEMYDRLSFDLTKCSPQEIQQIVNKALNRMLDAVCAETQPPSAVLPESAWREFDQHTHKAFQERSQERIDRHIKRITGTSHKPALPAVDQREEESKRGGPYDGPCVFPGVLDPDP